MSLKKIRQHFPNNPIKNLYTKLNFIKITTLTVILTIFSTSVSLGAPSIRPSATSERKA